MWQRHANRNAQYFHGWLPLLQRLGAVKLQGQNPIQKGPPVISPGASGKYYPLMDFDKDHLHRAVSKYAAIGEVAMKLTPPADLQDYKTKLDQVVHALGPRTAEDYSAMWLGRTLLVSGAGPGNLSDHDHVNMPSAVFSTLFPDQKGWIALMTSERTTVQTGFDDLSYDAPPSYSPCGRRLRTTSRTSRRPCGPSKRTTASGPTRQSSSRRLSLHLSVCHTTQWLVFTKQTCCPGARRSEVTGAGAFWRVLLQV